jgi:Fuc2NAc and GlcNAc transferase
MVVLLALSIAFVSTALLTLLSIKIGLRKGVLDIPNERSSHISPVPRGGGVAIVITFLTFLAAGTMFRFLAIDASVAWALIIGGTAVAIIGAVDDFGHVQAKWRFLVHLFAAAIALSLLESLPEISVFGFALSPKFLVFGVLTISLVWFVNLFNFMDGIDGITGVEAISALSGAALIMFIRGQNDWLIPMVFLVASVAGFLVWNWPPAKVFMGDVCSGFLGLTLGIIAIASSADGVISVWSWVILFGIFVVDATTTLVMRMCRGERWYQAHRSHAYQILSRRFNSHRNVSVGVLVINIVWLLPLAVLATVYSYWAAVICCAALLPLLLIAIRVGAGSRM